MGHTKVEQWERHNAENGEHIWCGDEHIADIVTDVNDPAWNKHTSEISKSAILMHNDPKYKVAPELYEALREVRDNAVLQKEENGFYILRLSYASWKVACKALSSAEGK